MLKKHQQLHGDDEALRMESKRKRKSHSRAIEAASLTTAISTKKSRKATTNLETMDEAAQQNIQSDQTKLNSLKKFL